MMRMLAWWGTTRAMSSAVTPAWSSDRWAESTITRTARRKTSLPSISEVAADVGVRAGAGAEPSRAEVPAEQSPGPSTARATTAPAPSPNRMAVLRSSQSMIRLIVSAPISRTRSMPMATSRAR